MCIVYPPFVVVYVRLFFFQAEDGIRDDLVTGVQTCALPISGVSFTYDATAFQAQQSALYGRVWQLDASGIQTGDIRVVRTDDEGLTWRAADEALSVQAGQICAFSATPAGATPFAPASTATSAT